jgi:UTP:GlnB (protein PII) uridylyltransferase
MRCEVRDRARMPLASASSLLERCDVQALNCTRSMVMIDNSSHARWTRLDVESPAFPGLLRTLTWVLNGLQLRVQHATVCNRDGWSKDSFWVTTWGGHKVTQGNNLPHLLILRGFQEDYHTTP